MRRGMSTRISRGAGLPASGWTAIGVAEYTRSPMKTIAFLILLFTTAAALAARAPTPVERANALLAQMTRDEKISLAANGGAGIPRLGIPGLAPSDGPNGVREGGPGKTAFPNAHIVAASWDRSLAEAFGAAIGAEASGKGYNILL